MPVRRRRPGLLKRKLLRVLRHGVVQELLVIVLILAVLYFGIKGALILSFQTEVPMMAVKSNSMKHDDNGWRVHYERENYDTSKFPFQGGFERGDLVIVRGTHSPEDVDVGDVIVFNREGEAHPIVHRVAVDENIRYKTKGDSPRNPNPDPGWVEFEDVIGEVVLVIPELGYLTLFWTET
ncbi:MAG: signal peptidase I [Candidatus Hadarchaeota archaeon]|nr:signal peptidase I [Candidatus Hadarchaeota archaeon]